MKRPILWTTIFMICGISRMRASRGESSGSLGAWSAVVR